MLSYNRVRYTCCDKTGYSGVQSNQTLLFWTGAIRPVRQQTKVHTIYELLRHETYYLYVKCRYISAFRMYYIYIYMSIYILYVLYIYNMYKKHVLASYTGRIWGYHRNPEEQAYKRIHLRTKTRYILNSLPDDLLKTIFRSKNRTFFPLVGKNSSNGNSWLTGPLSKITRTIGTTR